MCEQCESKITQHLATIKQDQHGMDMDDLDRVLYMLTRLIQTGLDPTETVTLKTTLLEHAELLAARLLDAAKSPPTAVNEGSAI